MFMLCILRGGGGGNVTNLSQCINLQFLNRILFFFYIVVYDSDLKKKISTKKKLTILILFSPLRVVQHYTRPLGP